MDGQLKKNYSGMPKSKHQKLEKRQNWNWNVQYKANWAEHSVPFTLVNLTFSATKSVLKRNIFVWILDRCQKPNRLELGQKSIVQNPNVFGFPTFTVVLW